MIQNEFDFSKRSINTEEILTYIISNLKYNSDVFAHYDYNVWIKQITTHYCKNKFEGINQNRFVNFHYQFEILYSNIFLSALWELCRLGILRLGPIKQGGQCVGEGEGYCITEKGKTWIAQWDESNYIPLEYSRYSKILLSFKGLFGDGFFQRAQEAVKCFNYQSYLACCAMCGAAVESILLKVSSEKLGEEMALKKYHNASGRKELIDALLQDSKNYTKNKFNNYIDLLLYWRDETSHGRYTNIDEEEAYLALTKLIRFSKFMESNWCEFID